MKKITSALVLCIATFSVQAVSYQCKQPNGKYLYSDKPCATQSEIPKDTLMTTASGRIAKLSTTPSPIPLSSEIVNGLFSRVENACQSKDGDALLTQFSAKIQQDYLTNKPKDSSIFDILANTCNLFTNIINEVQKSPDPVLYATKMPSKEILLCFYTASKGIENCRGDIRVTTENNQLKLNARY